MTTYVLIPGAGVRLVVLASGRPPSCGRAAMTWSRPTCPATTTRPGSPSTPTRWSTPSATARDLVVVAQSFGGFTAPLVCERVPVELLVLVDGDDPVAGRAARRLVGQHRLGAGTA